ncbi:MAG: PLP-dependent cysteine synthase family protein [Nitrososphaerales archaeon]
MSGHRGYNVLDHIGGTPLLQIEKIELPTRVNIFAKAEWFNPGGSIKDRSILGIITDGEKKGALTPDKILLDATSGNAGIAYAMIGASKGYKVQLAMPSNVSSERKRLIRSYGATIHFTDPLEGSDGAIKRARDIYAANPGRFFYGDQYNNSANVRAHYQSTGVEIINQLPSEPTHFIAGIGTSGTIMGTGRRLREKYPNLKIIAVEPDGPLHGIEGLKNMESALVPGIYDSSFPDEILSISTEDAQKTSRLLARVEGLLAGTSSGANIFACMKIAREISEGTIVTILPDAGERYLSEEYWSEPDSRQ